MNLNRKGIIIAAVLCFVSITVAAEIDNNSPPQQNKNKTTSTSVVPPTTAKTTTTTTTTAKPTLPPNTTTTSRPTPPPNTTTVAPPTTPKPTLPPFPVDPKQGKWMVQDPTRNITCIILDMAIQIELEWKLDNKTVKTGIDIPVNATASGSCDNTSQTIELSWPIQNYQDKISFTFNKVVNESKFELNNIQVDIINYKGLILNLVHNKSEFATPLEKSYKCMKKQIFNLTSTNEIQNLTAAHMKLEQVQLQAFHNTTNNNKFDDALDCASNETPDVVPIAVGCALAILVLIVLIAYLVGRRRSQARGYLSM